MYKTLGYLGIGQHILLAQPVGGMQEVEHAGRRTAYRVTDHGDGGHTLVFVHGSGADRRVWKSQDRLSRSHRIVSLDLSGHGDSDDFEVASGKPALQAYADDVAAVAEVVEADVLIGNSLGGAVVQWLLLERNLDVSAAVLVGSGAKLAVLESLRTWLAEDFYRAVEFLHGEDMLFADADPRLVEASRAAMYECGRRVTERDFLTAHEFDVRDRLGEIDEPVHAICGARDSLTPPSYHEYLAEHIPHGTYSVIEDAAHLVMLERPSRFNDELAAFLETER